MGRLQVLPDLWTCIPQLILARGISVGAPRPDASQVCYKKPAPSSTVVLCLGQLPLVTSTLASD